MILDEITIHNFGLYAGHQTIKLTPPAENKPVILVGGLNGGGKTTLLDALQLCLFGPHARISNRNSLAYPEYLSRCIHKGAAKPEAGVQIKFRHTVEGEEEHYVLDRSWRAVNGTCKERFQVLKNGHIEQALADNWATQVEEFVPANIAHLFLFDGEQIEGYASQQDSSALIGAAIQNLLGLDMVDQLEKDLLVYERRKRIEEKDDDARQKIAAAESELREARDRADALKQERASLRTHQIDRKRRELSKAEQKYRKLGGDLYDQRTEIERRLTDADNALRAGAGTLRELAGGALPFALVRPLLESADARDRHEEECRQARDLLEVLKTRDQAVLRALRSKRVSKNALDTAKDFFADDRAERRKLAQEQTVLDLLPETRGDLHVLLNGDLADTIREASRQINRQRRKSANATRARVEYDSIPDEDAIAELARERSGLLKEIEDLEAQHAALTKEIERHDRDVERKEQAYSRLLEAEASALGDREDRVRLLRHSAKVRTTLGVFRKTVIERHVRRIEQLVLESYQQLLRKASLVTRLSIHPESFSLTLYGRNGSLLSAERLSAGERQLLAIALLWGLAKASGRPLPTAIDTPLGRLDAGHRLHLVERYLPFASHQVLLLSTDEEIAGEYLDRLRPWIGRTYRLDYDDEQGQTRIVSGYFSAQEAA